MAEQYAVYGRELVAAEMQDRILDVPSGFLGDESLHPLWFHPNYELLEEYMYRVMSGEGRQTDDVVGRTVRKRKRRYTFHLVGTPGIGKSYFGHYWLFKQAKLGNRVVWRTKGDDPVYLFYDFSLAEPLVAASLAYTAPKQWAGSQRSIWMIIDGESRGVASHYGPVLQCVSPGRSGYHHAGKDTGISCYLEAWSLEDLKLCNQELQLGFSDFAIEQRFYLCGGIPRLVFDEMLTLTKIKDEMDDAATRAKDWKAVIRHSAGDGAKDKDISDYLLHYRLPSTVGWSEPNCYRVSGKELGFGSEYVEQMVCDLYEAQGFEAVQDFFDFCQGISSAQSLARKVFEKHIHKKLKAGGGAFLCSPLSCS